jgi:hypothetical protein
LHNYESLIELYTGSSILTHDNVLYHACKEGEMNMAEDPIKLFSTRAERYPEPTDSDVALGAGRAALAAIPFVGGSITEILSLVLAPAVSRRRDTWLKELAEALEELERRVDGFRVDNLAQHEALVSAIIQATRAAISTHQSEKLEALRNAVLNVALSKTADEEKQIFFLNLIEAFSATHLEILRLFANRATFPASRREELRVRRAVTDPMVNDLNNQGLLVDPRPFVARTRESSESLTIGGWTLSPLGNEFLLCIAVPEQLK